MAKNIYICSREVLPSTVEQRLYDLCRNLAPDNITPAEPKVMVSGDIAYGIMNPTSTLMESGTSLLMGQIFENAENWGVPLQDFPDGSYALFRNGDDYCEVVTDPVASRALWYYKDEEFFIAATSQRAIVMFLCSFEFDERIIPWMLSTGTLGPSFNWDKRIKRIPADSSIILNKSEWSVTTKSNPIELNLVKRTDEQHEKVLRDTLKTFFKSISIDWSKWVLPLSGGYDSRGILCLLLDANSDNRSLRTITWGLKSSKNVEGNDAFVARNLASKLNVTNIYYSNDLSEEPIEKIIDRFIVVGEGLIDNLSDYLDGFGMWKAVFENGIEGIVRGDEAFGWVPVSSPLAVRLNDTCCLCTDFSNLKNYRNYGFPLQELPRQLCRKEGETLSTWRDRVFQLYSQSVIQSALSDLKLSYVEQINPLLSKKILQQVRQLPDHLRNDRALFKRIVKSLSPDVDFPTSASSTPPEEILKKKQMVNLLKNELNSEFARTIFPVAFLDFVIKGIISEDQLGLTNGRTSHARSYFKKVIPHFVKDVIRSEITLPIVDPNLLAFRVLMICKMIKTLNNDSKMSKTSNLLQIT